MCCRILQDSGNILFDGSFLKQTRKNMGRFCQMWIF